MYRQRSNEWIRHLDFEVLDLFCIEITYFLIRFFRNGRDLDLMLSRNNIDIYLTLAMVDLICIFVMHPYKGIIQRGYWRELVAIVTHFTTVYACVIIIYYLNHVAESLPRLTVLGSWMLSMVFSYLIHTTNKLFIRKRLRRSRFAEQMFLVTDYENMEHTISQLTSKEFPRFQICAVELVDQNLDTTQKEKASQTLKKYGLEQSCLLYGMDEGREYLRQQVVDIIFLDAVMSNEEREDVIMEWLQMGLAIEIGLKQDYLHLPNAQLDHIGKRVVIRTTLNTAMSWQLAMKRLMDIAGALVGLVITLIAGIFIVPAIKIADPGPVIFSQKRVGTNGRIFNFYKFRSMYMDAEARKKDLMEQNQMQGLMFKMENDPRIIGSEKGPGKGLGNFLRKTSLDELPQFWNILKGDMSLVGTRPPTLGEYEMYEPRHKVRLSMKPGLTGMWQVSGRSDITDFEEVVNLDTQYIENWNLGMDIKILFKTVLVVLNKNGSR